MTKFSAQNIFPLVILKIPREQVDLGLVDNVLFFVRLGYIKRKYLKLKILGLKFQICERKFRN